MPVSYIYKISKNRYENNFKDFRIELFREQIINTAKSKFIKYLNSNKYFDSTSVRKKEEIFTNWLITQYGIPENNNYDPVIPDLISDVPMVNSLADIILKVSSLNKKQSLLEAEKIVVDFNLLNWVNESLTKIREYVFNNGNSFSSRRKIKIIVTKDKNKIYNFTDEDSNFNFYINSLLYDNLKRSYQLNIQNPTTSLKKIFIDDEDFHYNVITMILRYRSIDKDFLRQGSIIGEDFNYMNQKLGINFELFSSPMSSALEKYLTMFPDTDFVFGGVERFFDFHPEEGFYEMNPPLLESVTVSSVNKVIEWLTESEKKKKILPLGFLIFLPPWEDTNEKYVGDFRINKIFSECKFLKYDFMPNEHDQINYINYISMKTTKFRSPRISFLCNSKGNKYISEKEFLNSIKFFLKK